MLGPAALELLPPAALTMTAAVPDPGGANTTIDVEPEDLMLAPQAPKLTEAPDRLVPLMVTAVPTGPLVGLMLLTVGAGGGGWFARVGLGLVLTTGPELLLLPELLVDPVLVPLGPIATVVPGLLGEDDPPFFVVVVGGT